MLHAAFVQLVVLRFILHLCGGGSTMNKMVAIERHVLYKHSLMHVYKHCVLPVCKCSISWGCVILRHLSLFFGHNYSRAKQHTCPNVNKRIFHVRNFGYLLRTVLRTALRSCKKRCVRKNLLLPTGCSQRLCS